MRFNTIEEFDIKELSLDEENYRFKKASDQRACVNKIYTNNPPYFRGLMQSIAEDDLGEPLLVFKSENENVVADGNRRLSAMKVLFSDEFAPSESIKELAHKLRLENNIDLSKIQAQVSDQKALISRTVYERHSGGKNGTSRIPWNAYAAARFGFDGNIGDSKEWYIMALLSKTEEMHPTIIEFVDSAEFSYEVFRRLIRAAIKTKRISDNIFSERGERIKKTARADLLKDAYEKSHQILLAMKRKEISLSRKDGENYADKDTVEKFVSAFLLSPDNQEMENAKQGDKNPDDKREEDFADFDEQQEETNSGANDESDAKNQRKNSSSSGGSSSSDYGVGESSSIVKKISDLKSKKLKGLYNSLCKVSLVQHPALIYVGAWSFFEVLSKLAGNKSQEFPAFFRNKFQTYGIDKQGGKDCGHALDDISKYGNATKHSKNATPMSANQLKNSFEVLEPMILSALDHAISESKKTK